MPGYDVLEALHQNFDIHDSRVRGSGPRVEPMWPYTILKMYSILENLLLYSNTSYIYMRKTTFVNAWL